MHRKLISLVAATLVVSAAVAQEAEDPWSGNAGLSYLATSGNSDTETLGLDLKLERAPAPWGLEIVAAFFRAEDSGSKTSERYLAGLRGKRSINERWEALAGAKAERDRFSGINQRLTLEVGGLYKALNEGDHKLTFDGGLTWTDEEAYLPTLIDDQIVILQPQNDYLGAFLGLDWAWQITETTSLVERLLVLPNFDESDDWRYTSDTGLQVKMSERLAIKLGYQIRYDHLPAPGFDDTDTATTVALVLGL